MTNQQTDLKLQTEYQEYGYHNTESTYSHNYIFEPIYNELKKLKNGAILDLGCGNGSLANRLIALGYDVYGTDASEEGIKLAKKLNPDRFFVQDLNSNELPEPLRNKQFDTIISTEVIEHLYAPKKFIEFSVDILKQQKEGTLILSTPYNGYLKNMTLSIFNHWDKHLDPLWDGGHIKFWSKKTLIKLLSQYGFKDFKFIGCGRLPFLWKSMIIVAKI